jgi:hypothetical protein
MKQRALPLILAATIPCAGCTSSATAPSATTPPSTPATAPPRTPALESSSADSAAPGLHAPVGAEPVNLNRIGATAMVRCRSS